MAQGPHIVQLNPHPRFPGALPHRERWG